MMKKNRRRVRWTSPEAKVALYLREGVAATFSWSEVPDEKCWFPKEVAHWLKRRLAPVNQPGTTVVVKTRRKS